MDVVRDTGPGGVARCRVVFGPGSRHRVPSEVGALGAGRVLLLGHGRYADELADDLAAAGQLTGRIPDVVEHVPAEVARAAVDTAARLGADAVVSLGGGSATGLAKIVARETGLPVLAIPTTYAGSEMTPVWGLTDDGHKTTGKDPRVLPRSVVYDPELTVSLPPAVSAASGMNALAHCVEALYAPDATPMSGLQAAEGARALARSLPAVVADPDDLAARSTALCGAWLAGAVLGATTMGLHHKICHVLGGTFGLPHAATHSAVLPAATAFVAPSAPEAMAALGKALRLRGGTPPAAGLYDLAAAIGAPTALGPLGLAEADLGRAAELVVAGRPPSPRPLDVAAVAHLLRGAWAGLRPGYDVRPGVPQSTEMR